MLFSGLIDVFGRMQSKRFVGVIYQAIRSEKIYHQDAPGFVFLLYPDLECCLLITEIPMV